VHLALLRAVVTPRLEGQATPRPGVNLFVAGHFADPVPTAELLEQFGLTGLERRQSDGLSGGQKRRPVATTGVDRPGTTLLVLGGWTLLAGSLALWAYRRDEGRRLR